MTPYLSLDNGRLTDGSDMVQTRCSTMSDRNPRHIKTSPKNPENPNTCPAYSGACHMLIEVEISKTLHTQLYTPYASPICLTGRNLHSNCHATSYLFGTSYNPYTAATPISTKNLTARNLRTHVHATSNYPLERPTSNYQLEMLDKAGREQKRTDDTFLFWPHNHPP